MKPGERAEPAGSGQHSKAADEDSVLYQRARRRHKRQHSDTQAARALYSAILLGLTLAALLIAAANWAPETILQTLS